MKDCNRYTSGEVAESSLIKVGIVYVDGGDPPGGIDECMKPFAGCEGKVEEIVDGRAQMARAAVGNRDLVLLALREGGCLVSFHDHNQGRLVES
jgi:hypothetical protein